MGTIGMIVVLLSCIVGQILNNKFSRYSTAKLNANLTGAEVADQMLRRNAINDVRVTCTQGHLTDHYDPSNKTVNLSAAVYYKRNAASAAVAAHECGHAVQHAQGYPFLRFRSAMVPALSAVSQYMTWIILLGILVVEMTPLPLEIGIGLFGMTTLFAFVTLPVEFDASRRALAWMSKQGVVTTQEYSMAQDALKWAALTYVIAALGSLAQLLHLVSILNNRRRN